MFGIDRTPNARTRSEWAAAVTRPTSSADHHPEDRDIDLAREALIRMRPVLEDPALAGDQPVTITVADGEQAMVVPKSVLELLVDGRIEYRTVGTHRRVLARSLMEFMRADDQRRRGAAAELTALTQEMGLD